MTVSPFLFALPGPFAIPLTPFLMKERLGWDFPFRSEENCFIILQEGDA